MQVNFNEDTMRALVSKTIFENMTEEQKNELLKQAIVKLFDRDKSNTYGSKANILEQCFQSAAREIAEKIAKEKMTENPEFNKKINDLFEDVGKKLFEGEIREKMIEQICSTVVNGIRGDRY